MKALKLIAAAIGLSIVAPGLAAAGGAELNPKALTFELPDQIPWKRNAAGTNEVAVLHGDPQKSGLYIEMFKWLPGNMSRPHWHPNDRYITVLKGTWWVSTSSTFDPESAVPMPTGSYVTHYGKEIHYDGAKNEEVWLLIVGEGPETATPASTPPPAH
jgi:oxalate decarboxylase/phosphoglucose isomerase-like protein (cupin superfamily)